MTCCEAVKALHQDLRELYPVRIGNLEYDPVEVLKKLDPIAYWEAVNDYLDAYGVSYDCEPEDC